MDLISKYLALKTLNKDVEANAGVTRLVRSCWESRAAAICTVFAGRENILACPKGGKTDFAFISANDFAAKSSELPEYANETTFSPAP